MERESGSTLLVSGGEMQMASPDERDRTAQYRNAAADAMWAEYEGEKLAREHAMQEHRTAIVGDCVIRVTNATQVTKYMRERLNRWPIELPDDPVDVEEVPELVRCEDQGVRHKAILLVGVLPSGLAEILVLAAALHRDGVHFGVQQKGWAPGDWDTTWLLPGRDDEDDATPVKLYDTRKKVEEEWGIWERNHREHERREYQRCRDYYANEYNRECGEREAAVRDQHCRIRQLKDQHRRSMQANYTHSQRGGKENKRKQQPHGSKQNYARRNEMKFNNANVYKPKQQKKRKTQ